MEHIFQKMKAFRIRYGQRSPKCGAWRNNRPAPPPHALDCCQHSGHVQCFLSNNLSRVLAGCPLIVDRALPATSRMMKVRNWEGFNPISAAPDEKKDEGIMPLVVLGSFRKIFPPTKKPSMRAYTSKCNSVNSRSHSMRMACIVRPANQWG